MNDYFEEEFDQKVDFSIWKKLIKFAKGNNKTIITMSVAIVLVVIIDLVYPLLTKTAIDNFVVKETVDGLGWFIAAYAAFVLVQGICVMLFINMSGKLEMHISFKIRQTAFKKLQELSFSYYDTTAVGYLMARMISDIARLGEMIAWGIVDILWTGLYVFGVMGVLFVLNWRLALLAVAVLPVLLLVSIIFQKRILKQERIVRRTNSRITKAFNEGIMGAMTTKTLVREEANTKEFKEVTSEMRRASIKSALLSAMFIPIIMCLGSIGTGLVLFRGGQNVLMDVISYGTLAAFITYTMNFFEPVQQIARIFAEFQSAQASAERVVSLIELKEEIMDSEEVVKVFGDNFHPNKENWPEIKGEVEFRNVTFAYKTGDNILTDFNLHVMPGQNIALVGETGAGKSTIVNLACRFYEPTGGEVLIDGVSYKERSQLWLQSSLGYVLQDPHLFSGTIRDNIRYGKKDATDEEVIEAAKAVHAHEFILKQEKGYDTEVGEGGIRLSTGEKQLVSFARVVLANPRIFVLDEATSSVDTETELLIQTATSSVLKNRTSFVVAHRLSTIRRADRIIVIRNGKITEDGTHAQLIKLRGYYYDLYTNQFREDASNEILA